ncbi:hypothetical protein C5167_035832 [Papaver somniferum]|nr:hypothetical protein C5167_035832 [Papaver somniferum]
MPQTRSRSSQSSSVQMPVVSIDAEHLGFSSGSSVNLPELPACNDYDSDDDTYCHCPFKCFEECPYGVGGRGIRTEVSVYTAWERVLRQLLMWLCVPCMQCYYWKRPCRDHDGGIVNGPYNGRGADFSIHGIEKPTLQIPESRLNISVHIGECSSDSRQADDSLGLSVDMLNMVFHKQITIVTSIPPQCRLNFSRALKSSLDRVLGHPNDLSAWLHLLILPVCTLSLYFPKSSAEERSGNRK